MRNYIGDEQRWDLRLFLKEPVDEPWHFGARPSGMDLVAGQGWQGSRGYREDLYWIPHRRFTGRLVAAKLHGDGSKHMSEISRVALFGKLNSLDTRPSKARRSSASCAEIRTWSSCLVSPNPANQDSDLHRIVREFQIAGAAGA